MPVRNFDAAERILTARQRVERPLMVLIWVAITAYALSVGHAFYVLAGTLAVSLNLLATMRAKEVYVRRAVVNGGVLLATVILVVELFFTDVEHMVALGHYLSLILICKLFERKNNRDYMQMFFLSLLLMVAASLNTDSFWFGVSLVGFLALICYAGMVFTLKRGLDKAASAVLGSETAPPSVDQVAWNVMRAWPGAALRRKLLLTLLVVGWITLLSFLFLPRWPLGGGRVGAGPGSRGDGSGFSSSLRLGQPRQVYLTQDVLLLASYEGDWSKVPDKGYLRGQVMAHYRRFRDGRSSGWSRSADSSLYRWPLPDSPTGYRPATFMGLDDVPSVAIQAKASLGSQLFGVYPTVFIEMITTDEPPDTSPAATPLRDRLPAPRRPTLLVDGQLCWMLVAPPTQAATAPEWLTYRGYTPAPTLEDAESWVTRTHRGGRAPRLREPAASRPKGETIDVPQRVKELAADWCRDLLDQRSRGELPFESFDLPIAERIAGRLRSDYSYTLDLRDANPARDGVEDFLFHLRRGHCEYFASAMTVMCQSLDVRARLVTGFRVDESNRIEDGRYAARGLDAHAWTEVYAEPGGWRVIDATTSRLYEPSAAVTGWFSWLSREARAFWEDRVVGYDQSQQEALARGLRSGFLAAWDASRDWLRGVGSGLWHFWMTREADRAVVQFLLGLLAVSVVLEGVLIRRAIRRGRQESGQAAAMSLKTFALLERLFRRHGPPRAKHQTLRDQAAAAVAAGWPEDKLLPLLTLYQRVRWGGYTPPPEELDAAKRQMRELQTCVKTLG